MPTSVSTVVTFVDVTKRYYDQRQSSNESIYLGFQFQRGESIKAVEEWQQPARGDMKRSYHSRAREAE